MVLSIFSTRSKSAEKEPEPPVTSMVSTEDKTKEKAIESYNFELSVAQTISYMTVEILRSRLSYMKDNNSMYSQAVLADVESQKSRIAELEESLTELVLIENKEGERLYSKLQEARKLLSGLQLELQAASAFYISSDLIRARTLDMKHGASYFEIVENEKASWLQMHEMFVSI